MKVTMKRVRVSILVVALTATAFMYSNAKDPAPKNDTIAATGESQEDLKKRLTPLQYKVTQKNGTERAFQNEFWDNKKDGIYVDIVSGEPLFSSTHKFKSGTGWPSFFKSLSKTNVIEKSDRSHFMVRTEVRSGAGNSHLGHLFNDGPQPTGLRYCINSASLRFIPVAELKKQGFANFLPLFEAAKKPEAAPKEK